jgi:hypothetical protein
MGCPAAQDRHRGKTSVQASIMRKVITITFDWAEKKKKRYYMQY